VRASIDEFDGAKGGVKKPHLIHGNVATMQETLAAAKAARTKLREREASRLGSFGLLLSGQSAAALDAARMHLSEWPRDADGATAVQWIRQRSH
jgi:hypothetical protein